MRDIWQEFGRRSVIRQIRQKGPKWHGPQGMTPIIKRTKTRTTHDAVSGAAIPSTWLDHSNAGRRRKRGGKPRRDDMTRRVEPRVIDFREVFTPREEVEINKKYQALLVALRNGKPGIPHPLDCKGSITYTVETDGRLKAHTRPVPEWRMKRARRILWECQQHPDWPYRPSMFFRHPSLRNVPYSVLKRLVQESEKRNA